jgi:hypothetical protein
VATGEIPAAATAAAAFAALTAAAAGAFAALVSFRIQLDPFSVWSIRTRAFPFLAQHPGVSQLLYRIG